MKTYNKAIMGAAFLLAAALANAHGDHDEAPITKEIASSRGDLVVNTLVMDRKLAGSWQKKQGKKVEGRATPAGAYWVVSYENAEEKAEDKRTLYIFLDELGNYIGANHTGRR
jgi:hypothetical protein